MNFAPIFKFNPNHDPSNGQFSDGGSASAGGGGKVTPTVVGHNIFEDVWGMNEFTDWAAKTYADQGVKDWEAGSSASRDSAEYATYTAISDAYFSSSYNDVNQYLRAPATQDEALHKFSQQNVDTVLKAFDKYGVNIPAGSQLYRGLRGSFLTALDGLKVGDTFVDKGFTSTTPVLKTARDFGHNANASVIDGVMEITLGSGQKVLLATSKAESEVLFKPGRKFTFLGKRTDESSSKGPYPVYMVRMD